MKNVMPSSTKTDRVCFKSLNINFYTHFEASCLFIKLFSINFTKAKFIVSFLPTSKPKTRMGILFYAFAC